MSLSEQRQTPSLILGVKRTPWRQVDPDAKAADAAFQRVRTQILERDHYTCVFCGFRAEKYMEVHHLDDDHSNQYPANLATACPLCHQVFHIGLAGTQGRGVLILAPEISQVNINRLVHAIWSWMTAGDEPRETAITVYERLRERGHELEAYIGDNASDPSLIGDLMLNGMSDEEYANREQIFAGVRLLPNLNAFPEQVKAWARTVYKTFPREGWESIRKQLIQVKAVE